MKNTHLLIKKIILVLLTLKDYQVIITIKIRQMIRLGKSY